MKERSVAQVIGDRRSIRRFKADPVERSVLEDILRAGIAAPSSKNRQPWHLTVLEGAAKERVLRVMEQGLAREKEAETPFLTESGQFLPGAVHSLSIMRQAPVLVLMSNSLAAEPDFARGLERDVRVGEICNIQSVAAAIENMLLAAEERGIGSLWLGDIFFAYPELQAWLDREVPGHGMLVAGISFGHPDETPGPRPRKDFTKSVTFFTE